jgi:hypothetical protein
MSPQILGVLRVQKSAAGAKTPGAAGNASVLQDASA